MNGITHIGVSVITMCHNGAGKYLISRRGPKCRDENDRWEPAGGGTVEHGESLLDAVQREVKEECGANVLEVECIGYREVMREHNGAATHWIAFDFRARIDPLEVSIQEPEKCSEHRWCAIDDIPVPMHSQFPLFLDKYKEIL